MTPNEKIAALEQRIAQLERTIDSILVVKGKMVEFVVPVRMRKELTFYRANVISNDGAAEITSGNGAPVSAPVGSLFLKLNGTANNTLFVMEPGGWSSTA